MVTLDKLILAFLLELHFYLSWQTDYRTATLVTATPLALYYIGFGLLARRIP